MSKVNLTYPKLQIILKSDFKPERDDWFQTLFDPTKKYADWNEPWFEMILFLVHFKLVLPAWQQTCYCCSLVRLHIGPNYEFHSIMAVCKCGDIKITKIMDHKK